MIHPRCLKNNLREIINPNQLLKQLRIVTQLQS
jgi:hypothetical protein